jgi:uncharacterized protein (DUF1810 family)
MTQMNDPFDLNRFLCAQEKMYNQALRELKNGHKRSHWIWYIFPQLEELGYSEKARYYGIKSVEEAREYVEHSILGKRLRECTEAVLAVENKTIAQIMNTFDDVKLQSCMTLFACVTNQNSLFLEVIAKYYNGQQDSRTIELLQKKVNYQLP